MRLVALIACLLTSFVLSAQTKTVRKLNDAEYQNLKLLFEDFENFLKVNLNDTVYEHQRNFNMKFTPTRLHSGDIQVWDDRDPEKQDFAPVFSVVKYDKASGRFGYNARLVLNPLNKPDVLYDELRKYYYFEVPVRQVESWKELSERIDTVVTLVKDTLGVEGLGDKVDTSFVKVVDTLTRTKNSDRIFITRTTETNRVFGAFKIYAVTIKGKKPVLEPLSEEMRWWLKLDDSWRSFFKEKYKLANYPENYEIRKCQGLRELDVSNKPVSDVSFLANFTFLEKLNLSKTQVKDLSPIKDLKRLKELNLAGSKVDTLLYLKDLINLEVLDISGLQIYSLENIAGLVKMRELTCGENKLTNLEPLRDMAMLEELDISLNYAIKDVAPITGLVTLEKLRLKKVAIGSLEPLTGLVNLVYLDCFNAGISDLSPLSKLPKLMHLDISHNSVSDLSPIRSLNYITYLALASTKISDLSPISRFRHLEYLNVSGNPQIKSISAVPDETLQTLIAHYSGLPTGEIQRFKKKNPKCKITYY